MSRPLATELGSHLNLASGFHRQMLAGPERPALWIEGVAFTYAELGDCAARIAGWLNAAGIGRESRVGVLASRSKLAYAGILGSCWSGATYVPLHPRHPEARLIDLVRRGELSALIVDPSGASALSEALLEVAPRHLLVSDNASSSDSRHARLGEQELSSIPPVERPMPVSAADLAYLMFTSGTTGVPKGVMVTTTNVAHCMSAMQSRYRIEPSDRCSQFFELTFDLSVFDLFMTWNGGACLHSISESERMAPAKFIRERALTTWFAVPSAIAFMARVKSLAPNSLPSLRLSLFCGEALPAESAQLWRQAAPQSVLENLYGPTEATIACLVEPCSETIHVTKDRGIVAIGSALDGMRAAIVDEQRQFLPPGSSGELVLSGEQVAAGYWRDAELSANRFVVLDHPQWGKQTFYFTHDVATLDGDGRFHFQGRLDNQVKIHGHRVELEEIDAHLQAITGAAAAAIAWPVVHGSADGVVAFLTAKHMSADEVKQRLRMTVPWYMVPRKIVNLDALPLTPNGKIDRNALREMLQGAQDVA